MSNLFVDGTEIYIRRYYDSFEAYSSFSDVKFDGTNSKCYRDFYCSIHDVTVNDLAFVVNKLTRDTELVSIVNISTLDESMTLYGVSFLRHELVGCSCCSNSVITVYNKLTNSLEDINESDFENKLWENRESLFALSLDSCGCMNMFPLHSTVITNRGSAEKWWKVELSGKNYLTLMRYNNRAMFMNCD